MPNWVKNRVTIHGSEEDICTIQKLVKAKDNDFDFNSIKPMPKSLNIVAGGLENEAILAYLSNNAALDSQTTLKTANKLNRKYSMLDFTERNYNFMATRIAENGANKMYNFSPSDDVPNPKMMTLYDAGKTYVANIKAYGSASWYEWSKVNWGTKWNACNINMLEESPTTFGVEFETAWSTPIGIFVELTQRFPNITMTVLYADEDIGHNCGRIEYTRNELQYIDENDVQLACDVWGYDADEYLAEYDDNDENEE